MNNSSIFRRKAAIQIQVIKKPESGFSLLELVIVVAVILIVAAMAVPSMERVLDAYRLTTSGRDVANMLQQTRMSAVQNNQPYYPQVIAGQPMLASAQSATEMAGGTAPASTPTVMTSGSVTFQGTGPGTTKTLDTFVGTGTPLVGSAIPSAGSAIGFNARGIPCQQQTANPFSCTPVTTGIEWFMKSNASNQWEAVTVTPAGRVRSWRQTSSGTWQ